MFTLLLRPVAFECTMIGPAVVVVIVDVDVVVLIVVVAAVFEVDDPHDVTMLAGEPSVLLPENDKNTKLHKL